MMEWHANRQSPQQRLCWRSSWNRKTWGYAQTQTARCWYRELMVAIVWPAADVNRASVGSVPGIACLCIRRLMSVTDTWLRSMEVTGDIIEIIFFLTFFEGPFSSQFWFWRLPTGAVLWGECRSVTCRAAVASSAYWTRLSAWVESGCLS